MSVSLTHLLILQAVDDRDEVRGRQRGAGAVVLHGDVRAAAHLLGIGRLVDWGHWLIYWVGSRAPIGQGLVDWLIGWVGG